MKLVVGAKLYVYEHTSMPLTNDSNWSTTIASRASVIISNLISGGHYCFRAVAVGANPTLVYSDIVSTYVLVCNGN